MLKPHFLHSRSDSLPLKTWELSPINMPKGSIRIFPRLKKGRVEMGSKNVEWLLIESYKEKLTGEHKWQKKTK
jgi:hypothetical protein